MRLAPIVSTRATQRQTIAARTVQAIGMIAMEPADVEAVIAEHVERNPFLSRAPGAGSAGDPHAFEAHLADMPTLRQHVGRQIAEAFADGRDRVIASRLADELDDAGYFRLDTASIAASLRVPEDGVERVLARCRGLEPAGLFARDLRECLTLQLRARGEWDEPMAAVIERLDMLARGQVRQLAALVGLEPREVAERAARIRRCDPKPAAGWRGDPLPSITPVARVQRTASGAWSAVLLQSAFPRVVIDEAYAAPLLKREDTADFARAALRDGRWLENALRRRAETIEAVVREIVVRQSQFLDQGESALRPLTMARIADVVGVHETTVGRAIAGKSIETPRGTILLRAFFGSGVFGAGGAFAARAVARRIERIVANERPDAPYSDDRLAHMLRSEGVEIARRTVAKYRRQLDIGSASERRRTHVAPDRPAGVVDAFTRAE